MSTKKSTQQARGQAPKKPAAPANIEQIIAEAKSKIPAQLRPMFDKVILSGERLMFDKGSYHMTEEMLERPGPLAKRLSDGIVTLIYMLWEKSNKTIPPQLIVPATLVLTLRAFQFVQESKDPEATDAVMGEAVADAVQGVMDRFGATQDKIPALLRGQSGQVGAAPEQGGLMAAATGAQQ